MKIRITNYKVAIALFHVLCLFPCFKVKRFHGMKTYCSFENKGIPTDEYYLIEVKR